MKYKISIKNKISKNTQKVFLEKAYYFNENINKITFKKNLIIINTDKKINFKKLKKTTISYLEIILKTSERTFDEVIYESRFATPALKRSPYNLLIKKQYIKKILEGIFSIEGEFLKLKNYIDNTFNKIISKKSYLNTRYSGVVSLRSIIDNNYLSSFTNHCVFISNVKRNLSSINDVSRLKILNLKGLKKNLIEPDQILSPTVCFNCFESFKNKKINKQVKITAIGNCHRYESLNYKTLERLKIYSMREWILMGNKNFVKINLNDLIKKFKIIFNRWKIKYRICTASDPFFSNKEIQKKIFQYSNKLKYELQIYLPFEKKWLAVASFNNHLDTMIKSYNIKSTNKKKLYSGCVGIGYERLLYGIFSQKGINGLWKK